MKPLVILCVVVVAVFLASSAYGSQDNHKKCKKWAENGKCSKNKVKRLCPKSCNLGGGGGGGGAGAGGGGGGSCGVSRFGHSRVIGGDDATPGAWPWQVGLHTSGGGFFCGGTLITPEWVVTAAHCISSTNPSHYVLRLGDHNRHRNEGTEQNIPASEVIKHPKYGNGGRLNNDIALIKLSRAAKINNRVSPACLPKANYIVPPRSNCYITGWGKIKHPGSTYHTLQQAKISPVSESDCKSIYNGITKQMLCAGDLDNGRGGCHGDSGGPFVCKGSNGLWFLQGAVSFGRGDCNAQRAYTVFARVSMFRGWIDQYVK